MEIPQKTRKFIILPKALKIVSWNIDKLRIEVWDKLKEYILKNHPDIICLNETKLPENELIVMFDQLKSYNYIINSHYPSRWHGVAILIKKHIKWEKIDVKLNCPPRNDNKSDDPTKGRLICILVNDDFYLLSTYVPNSGVDRKCPLKNLPYRLEWDKSIYELLNKLKEIHPTIWLGDLNVAPEDIDVSNPSRMRGRAGFTKEERESFKNFLLDGWIDIWRKQHPEEIVYSYRGYRNYPYKWRLDHMVVNKEFEERIMKTFILDNFNAPTDHVPIGCSIIL